MSSPQSLLQISEIMYAWMVSYAGTFLKPYVWSLSH